MAIVDFRTHAFGRLLPHADLRIGFLQLTDNDELIASGHSLKPWNIS
jgi:hypothetical protein